MSQVPFEVEENEKISRIKKMIPRGVVFLTYIIAENEDGMYIIDQHAAAERINFEKIIKQMKEKPIIIDLLVPRKIELRKDELILAKERFDLLKKYGIDISKKIILNVAKYSNPRKGVHFFVELAKRMENNCFGQRPYKKEIQRLLLDSILQKEENQEE